MQPLRVASLCFLSALSCSAVEAQTSKPVKAKPVKATAKTAPLGRLLFNVHERGADQVMLHDFASGKTKPFLGGKGLHVYAVAVSPAGKTVAVVENTRPAPGLPYRHELLFRSVANPKKVLLTLPQGFTWAAFLDESRALVEEHPLHPNAADAYRIVEVDLTKGTRKVVLGLNQRGGRNTPLALSPDKKRVVFYVRDGKRGFRLLDLKTKKVTTILPGATYLRLSPDGQRCMAFVESKKALFLFRRKKGGAGFNEVKRLSARPAYGGWLTPDVRLIGETTQRDPRRFWRGPLRLTYHDAKTKQTVKVSDKVPCTSYALLRPFTRLRRTTSFVWIEATTRAMWLMQGLVQNGKLTKKELFRCTRLALPFSIP